MYLPLSDFELTFIFRTIALSFDENLNLHTLFQTGKMCVYYPHPCWCTLMAPSHSDYSGLPLLRAISSKNGQPIHGFSQFWIYGSNHHEDEDGFPFLFIDGGARTLSGSTNGSAVIRDTVTQRQIQFLEHDGDFPHALWLLAAY